MKRNVESGRVSHRMLSDRGADLDLRVREATKRSVDHAVAEVLRKISERLDLRPAARILAR